MNSGGLPRAVRSHVIYAAAAANAWLRGLSIPTVTRHYRYEPVTALLLIRGCCTRYGNVALQAYVPACVLAVALRPETWLPVLVPEDRATTLPRGSRSRAAGARAPGASV